MIRKFICSFLAMFASTAAAPDAHAIFGEGYCQKTFSGQKLCVKKENISCKKVTAPLNYNGYSIDCKVSGILTDLTGSKVHWTTSRDAKSWSSSGTAPCYFSLNYDAIRNDTNSLTCDAAQHFNKVAPHVTLTKQITLQVRKEAFLRNNEELLICSTNNYRSGKIEMIVLAINKSSGGINEVLISQGYEVRHPWSNWARSLRQGDYFVNSNLRLNDNMYYIYVQIKNIQTGETFEKRLNCNTSTQVQGFSS